MPAKRSLRLALIGFGSIGQRFAELLAGPYGRALRGAGVQPKITAIATGRHGFAIDGKGLSVARSSRAVRAGRALTHLHRGRPVSNSAELIERAPADVVIELSPLDPGSGEPAISHIRRALDRGRHVVTANKGPVAFAHKRLTSLARRRNKRFLFEGAVMDGTPIFNLVQRCLRANRVLGFRGALNSTTTRILTSIEQGGTFAAALRAAQDAGVAEADPSNDIEGWDAAVKGCAIANALMGAAVKPGDVRRTGLGVDCAARATSALASGRRLRLVVRGQRQGRSVIVCVAPEELDADDLLVSRGADGVVVLETDLMGEIGIWEGAGGVDQTAYAVLSDLLAIVED